MTYVCKTADDPQPPPFSQMRLREEIETLEKRLVEIRPDGDCGYERALIRFFNLQIEKRRRLLQESEYVTGSH